MRVPCCRVSSIGKVAWLVLFSLTFGGIPALGARPTTAPATPIKEFDLSKVLSAAKPKLVINIISVRLMTTIGFDKKGFDEQLQWGVGCFALQVLDPRYVKKLCGEIMAIKFVPSKKKNMDIRYRFDFLDGETLLGSYYIDAFGTVLLDDQLYEPQLQRKWLHTLFSEMSSDLFL